MASLSSLVVACLVLVATTQVFGYDSALYEDMLFQDLYKRLNQMDDAYYPLDEMRYGGQQPVWDEDSVIPLDSRDSGQADIRDPEYLAHSSNSDGFQYISGGAGEGKQHLTPEGTQENTQEVKSDDVLPFYCHPPNPCPKGFTEEDGCQLNIKDSAEAQKEWISKMQDNGMCTCDEEHMFDCRSAGKSTDQAAEVMQSAGQNDVSDSDLNDLINTIIGDKGKFNNLFAKGNEIKGVVAKKSPRIKRSVENVENELKGLKFKKNPYLRGSKIYTVAKKGMHVA